MDSDRFSFWQEGTEFTLDNPEATASWLGSIFTIEEKDLEHIEYIFCSDDYLLEVNRQYLDHDYYTDIITFPLTEDPVEATIFISVDRVKDNAEEFDQTFSDELHRVMAHGILHLIGYNDATDDEKKLMRQKENEYLSLRDKT